MRISILHTCASEEGWQDFLNYKIVVNFCKITAEWFLQGEGLIFPVSPAVPKAFLQKGFSVLMKEEK